MTDIHTHSINPEQALLGALMLNEGAWPDVAELVTATDFSRAQHQLVFEAIAALAGEHKPLDAVAVCERLRSAGRLKQAGGIAYLAELLDGTPGAANAARLAHRVRQDIEAPPR